MRNLNPPLRVAALFLLFFSLFSLLCQTPAAAAEDANEHFTKGKQAFEQKNYEVALAEMQRVTELLPSEPLGFSGKAACLNALGRFPEAKQSLDEAFRLLQAQRNTLYTLFNPIDLDYFVLMADIQANLHDFAGAVQTINKYPQQKMKEAERPKAAKAVEAPRTALRAKLISVGSGCIESGNLQCARDAFAQAETLSPAAPETLLGIAKTALNEAEQASATTDEEKARKLDLYRMSIEYFNRLPQADRASTDNQRLLARALSGTKDPQDYQKAIGILSGLTDSAALLDLAAAYSNNEEYEKSLDAVNKYLQGTPKDPRAGYCRRSYVNYRMRNCQAAIDDGAKCTNPDGTPRHLAYLDYCRAELARQRTVDTTRSEDVLKNECTHLKQLVDYAMSPDAPVEETADIIRELESSKSKCRPYLGTVETSTVCLACLDMAKNPMNLSLMSAEELQKLFDKTGLYFKLCGPHLNDSQRASVQSALKLVSSKLTP